MERMNWETLQDMVQFSDGISEYRLVKDYLKRMHAKLRRSGNDVSCFSSKEAIIYLILDG